MFLVYVVLCLIVFGCQYHCSLERLVSEMTYYVSSGTLNPTHSLTYYDDMMNNDRLCRYLSEMSSSAVKLLLHIHFVTLCYH